MAHKYNKASLRRQIYGALSSYLDQACVIDTDNPEYMDALFAVQQKMAGEFRAKSRGDAPAPKSLTAKKTNPSSPGSPGLCDNWSYQWESAKRSARA